MALSKNTLPSIVPRRVLPFDVATAFCNGQTLTATGYFDGIQKTVDLGPGRFTGFLALDLSALDLSSTDETYKLMLLGSNDAAFGNGNVELLALRDFAAATAGRVLATICPASDAVPETNRAASRFEIPFSNQMGVYVFRYTQLYLVAGGTTPSITLAAWVAPDFC
jgi:hypothetical protein